MKKLFGTDGIRGIANELLTPTLALKIGMALGTVIKERGNGCVLIGKDTRISAPMLESAISAGLTAMGLDVILLGVVPTPAVAYLTKSQHAMAGVMISASHNSYEYNGIKIFGPDGFKLNDSEEERIEALIERDVFRTDRDAIGTITSGETLVSEYIEHLKSNVPTDFSGIKVAFDCSNGSASATAERIFGNLGCKARFLFDSPNGININAGCGSTHLEDLKNFVIENKMDIGLAFDGDADRCLAIDEHGNEVDGDYIMAILSLALKDEGKLEKNTTVGTVMSNYGFQKFCKDNGIAFIGTKVGDRYVLEELERCGYSFGGEQSGHIIMRELMTTGDGELTALLLLARMKKMGKSLSELASVMQKFPQHMVNISANADEKAAFSTNEDVLRIIEDAKHRLGDSGRILVRPSGTEPLVRIMVESLDAEETFEVCESVAAKIDKILRK